MTKRKPKPKTKAQHEVMTPEPLPPVMQVVQTEPEIPHRVDEPNPPPDRDETEPETKAPAPKQSWWRRLWASLG